MNDALLVLAPPLLIVPAMGFLSRLRCESPVMTEIRRKALHVSIGFAALGFPYLLTQPWMVLSGLMLVAAWMLAVRYSRSLGRRFGLCLSGAGRDSWGELYFALALAFLLLSASPGSPAYVIPVLLLAIPDALAAIVGRAWPAGPYRLFGGQKSLAGSGVFFITAFGLTAVLLQAAGVTDTVRITLLVAATTTLLEAASPRGTDNLTVPLSAWLVLRTIVEGA